MYSTEGSGFRLLAAILLIGFVFLGITCVTKEVNRQKNYLETDSFRKEKEFCFSKGGSAFHYLKSGMSGCIFNK